MTDEAESCALCRTNNRILKQHKALLGDLESRLRRIELGGSHPKDVESVVQGIVNMLNEKYRG